MKPVVSEVAEKSASLVALDETISDRYNNKVNDDGDVSKWP